ncbi:MAG TPA: class I SAM-dependent methyltransferase [Gammaproteobacteria bacterium]|nr:class I SAM-dependent methyltransferase [Gammaproteobacteria bacterium]
MSNKTITLTGPLHDYLLAVSLHEPALLRELREETARLPEANMQIAPEQGQFMALMVKLMGVRRALEIGVFTGYSALSVALHLPADGRLIACDVSERWTAIGRRYFARAGVAGKIDLRIAPALDTLGKLLADGQGGGFDFVFIDADKENYIAYYEACLQLLRPGGLIMVDNVLWDGKVADPGQNDGATCALRAFNAHVHADDRIKLSMLPLADGLTLILKL